MKNILYTLLFIFSVVGFISCEDDAFLEEHPKDIFTPETAFTSSKQVDDQIITAYRALAGTYNETWWLGLGADLFDTEDYVSGFGANGESNFSRLDENSYNNRWNSLYQIASYANLALSGSELVEWDSETEKNYEVAQAKFFRGWAYLRLGEMFGGVPIVEEYSEVLKLDYTRSTREQTYQFAIDNLEAALTGLPSEALEDGRVTPDVVNHFLSEAYIAMGIETGNADYYDDAIDAATIVINNHPLMTDRFGVRADPLDGGSRNGVPNYRADGDVFYDLFRIGNYDAPENTESVWVAKSGDYDTYQEYVTGGGWLRPSSDSPDWIINPEGSAAPVFRDIAWAPEYIEEGAANGPFSGNIDLTIYPGGQTGPYCGGFSIGRMAPTKYVQETIWGDNDASPLWDDMRNSEINYSRLHLCLDRNHSMYGQPVSADMIVQRGGGFNQYFPLTAKIFNREDLWAFEPAIINTGGAKIYGRDKYLIRSAETYLLRAEAYLRAGSPDLAADDINTLRQRANCTKLFTESEVDIYTILDERVRELSYEEHRWATLLRIGGEVFKNQIADHAMYVADAPTPIADAPDWDLLAIPLDAVIGVNTGAEIEQNPGW